LIVLIQRELELGLDVDAQYLHRAQNKSQDTASVCWLWSPEGGACEFSTSEFLVAKKLQAEVGYTLYNIACIRRSCKPHGKYQVIT
jgi:hypothetical protein